MARWFGVRGGWKTPVDGILVVGAGVPNQATTTLRNMLVKAIALQIMVMNMPAIIIT